MSLNTINRNLIPDGLVHYFCFIELLNRSEEVPVRNRLISSAANQDATAAQDQ